MSVRAACRVLWLLAVPLSGCRASGDLAGASRPLRAGADEAPALADARSCADLRRINQAFAAQHMQRRGRPYVIEEGIGATRQRRQIRTGTELAAPWSAGCTAIGDGFLGLVVKRFEHQESYAGDDDFYDWTVEYDIVAYLPEQRASGVRNLTAELPAPGVSCVQSPGWADSARNECAVRALGDLDRDGNREIVLEQIEEPRQTGSCTRYIPTYKSRVYSIVGGRLIPYQGVPPLASELAFAEFRDHDKDGYLDYWSFADYQVPRACQPKLMPGFLLHGQPGGTFSATDAVAREGVRAWCPRPPAQTLDGVPTADLAAHVICARLWGTPKETLTAALERRCTRSPEGEATPDGGISYRGLPWGFCYHPGDECTHAVPPEVCGAWLAALADVEPPFTLR